MAVITKQSRFAKVSDQTVSAITQGTAFVAALLLFPMCVVAATKFAASPFEIFVGVVLGGVLSVSLVVLGLVIPVALQASRR